MQQNEKDTPNFSTAIQVEQVDNTAEKIVEKSPEAAASSPEFMK